MEKNINTCNQLPSLEDDIELYKCAINYLEEKIYGLENPIEIFTCENCGHKKMDETVSPCKKCEHLSLHTEI